jgi:hypothetical protein
MKNFNTDEFLKSLEPLYVEGRIDEAISLMRANEAHLDAWIYHFNLGTLYGKMEMYGAGRHHLEKALTLPGDRSLVLTNLEFVLDKLGPVDSALGLTQVESWAVYLLRIPEQYALILTLFLLVVVTIIWKFKKFKKWYTFGLVALVAFVPVLADQMWLRSYQVAIVLEQAIVRTGPSGIFEEKSVLPEGSKILLKSSLSGQWYQVIKPQAAVGWIESEKCGLL